MQRTHDLRHINTQHSDTQRGGSTRSRRLMLAAGLLSLTALCVGGCGKDNALGRLAISGNVTLDGEPLAAGTIDFSPQDPAGVASGAAITAGAYAIVAERGLPPGTYDVRIYSPDTESPPPDGPPGPTGPNPVEERLPARYNAQTELSITVTADGQAVFDFPLEGA